MKRFILLISYIAYTLSIADDFTDDSIFHKLDYLQSSANYSLSYAYAAYDTNKTEIQSFKDWKCPCCVPHQKLQNMTYIDTEANFAYVGYNSIKKQIFVVFRGTFNACDWFCTDFDVAFTDYKDPNTGNKIGRVHAGFYDRWKTDLAVNVTTRVFELIDYHFGNNSCSIMVTGHSLGASISQIAAISFADNDEIDCDIYNINFGSPYWADSDMINHYQQQLGNNSWRVVHRYDPVPWVKPNPEYKHTPIFIHYHSHKCSLHNVICKQDDKSDQCYYSFSDLCIYDHTHYIGSHDTSCNKCSDYDCGIFSHDDFEVDIDETSTVEEIGALWGKICDKFLDCKDEDTDIAIRYQCSVSLIIVLFLCNVVFT